MNRYLTQHNPKEGRDLDNWLNEMSSEGWELVTAIRDRDDSNWITWVFRRERQPETPFRG